MGAIVNGMVLSKLRAYGSTFLIFSDYMKMPIPFRRSWKFRRFGSSPTTPSRRRRRTDAPTHRAIDTLRAIPGLITLRPADANEVVEAWKIIMHLRKEPVALALTRQALPTFDRSKYASAPAWLAARTSSPTPMRQTTGDFDGYRAARSTSASTLTKN